MKTIQIGDNLYKFEYSIEASLYEECSECIMDFFVGIGMTDASAELGNEEKAVNGYIKTMTSIPVKTLTLFYAGLLEHHSDTIRTKDEAKKLLAEYIRESGKSFVEVFRELTEIVEEDNFFTMIGLDKTFTETPEPKKRNRKVGENTSTGQ